MSSRFSSNTLKIICFSTARICVFFQTSFQWIRRMWSEARLWTRWPLYITKHPNKPAIPTPDCFLKTIKAYCLFVWKPWISLTFQWECFIFPGRSFTNLNVHSGSFFVTFVGVDLIKQSDDVTVTNHRLIQIIQTSRKVSRMQKYFFLPQQPGLAGSW